jgi:hypothetical protein
MRRFLVTFILVFSVFAVPKLHARQAVSQQASAAAAQGPAQDSQAIAILRRSLVAMGGQGAASIQDTVVHASSTPAPNAGGEPGDVTITTKGASLIRVDGSAGKNASTIYNAGRETRSSDHGWQAAPGANAHHKRIEHLPALMLAYEIARSDLSATYIGEETVETRTVHHIRVARDPQRGDAMDAQMMGISQLDIFIDAQTLLITKVAFPYASEIDWRITFPIEIYYDQYQVVSGISVPFHQRYFFNGQPISVTQITSVAVNQGTPDSLFEAK